MIETSLTAAYWINKLGLKVHPEGGYYKEIYRSPDLISVPDSMAKNKVRPAGTSIYYLLEKTAFSAFHILAFDEIYHYYAGGLLKIWVLDKAGTLSEKILGPDAGEKPAFQIVIPKGSWFASEVVEGDYCLSGCTVAPGFDFEDFELADAAVLVQAYPQHSALIQRLSSKKLTGGVA